MRLFLNSRILYLDGGVGGGSPYNNLYGRGGVAQKDTSFDMDNLKKPMERTP